MQLAMMPAAERDRELITDFGLNARGWAKRKWCGGRMTSANKAGLRSDKPQVGIAPTFGLGQGEHALVDLGVGASGISGASGGAGGVGS